MATHVTVISSTLRQAKVKVTPGKPMSEVLAEACNTFGLEGDTNYALKHKNKNVDLSVPFRLSGLPNGARLDLVVRSKSTGVVTMAVALPSPENQHFESGRLIRKFPGSFSLWQVLRQVEESDEARKARLNVTGRGVPRMAEDGRESGAGQLYYETPVLSTSTGRTFDTLDTFRQTLAHLGYNSGTVLMHLSFRPTDRTLAEAQEEIGKVFSEMEQDMQKERELQKEKKEAAARKEEEKTKAAAEEASAAPEEPQPAKEEPVPEAQAETAPQLPGEPMELDGATETEATTDSLQPVSIYAAPSSSTPAAARAPFDESDYITTVADVQHQKEALQQQARNKRLPSDRELEEQAAAHAAKLASVKSMEVRVRFPDNTSASWVLTQDDTGAKLYRCVRSVMHDASLPFRLLLPPRELIRDLDTPANRIIKKHQLTGRGVTVNLVWDDAVGAEERRKAFLKDSAAQQAKEIEVPQMPEVKRETGTASSSSESKPSGSNTKSEMSPGEKMKKLSKFFNLGGGKK